MGMDQRLSVKTSPREPMTLPGTDYPIDGIDISVAWWRKLSDSDDCLSCEEGECLYYLEEIQGMLEDSVNFHFEQEAEEDLKRAIDICKDLEDRGYPAVIEYQAWY